MNDKNTKTFTFMTDEDSNVDQEMVDNFVKGLESSGFRVVVHNGKEKDFKEKGFIKMLITPEDDD